MICGIFLFYLDLELFPKIKRCLVFTHSFFTLLLMNQDLSIMKGLPRIVLWALLSGGEGVCRVSAGDIGLWGSWSSLGFSIFQPGFLGVVGGSALVWVSGFAWLGWCYRLVGGLACGGQLWVGHASHLKLFGNS